MKPVAPILSGGDGFGDLLKMGLEPVVYAKDQPEYIPLPVVRCKSSGRVTSRWRLDWRNRLRVFLSGNLWLQQLTFGQPLQPVKLLAVEPTAAECL